MKKYFISLILFCVSNYMNAQITLNVEHSISDGLSSEITTALGGIDVTTVSILKITGNANMTLTDCHAIRDAFKDNLSTLNLEQAKFENNKIPDGGADQGAFSAMNIESVLLPDNLTEIGDRAFHSCIYLTNINLPNSITRIGDYGFYKCLELSSSALPDNLITLGSYAFQDCSNITFSQLPTGLQGSIGVRTFQNAAKITVSKIPDGIISIGSYAFRSCILVESLIVSPQLSSIGNQTFDKCTGLKNIYFKGNIPPSTGTTPFSGVTLTDINVYVPTGKLSAFNISPWNEMKGIIEYDPTGIRTNRYYSDISVYPNPTTGKIIISQTDQNKVLNLCDLEGRLLTKVDLSVSDEFDISFLPKGIYVLKTNNTNFKVIKY